MAELLVFRNNRCSYLFKYNTGLAILPWDVFLNIVLFDGHHRQWFVGAQPVRLVVSTGVVAHVVEVTEQERHGREFSNARTGETWTWLTFFVWLYYYTLYWLRYLWDSNYSARVYLSRPLYYHYTLITVDSEEYNLFDYNISFKFYSMNNQNCFLYYWYNKKTDIDYFTIDHGNTQHSNALHHLLYLIQDKKV